MNMKTLAVLCLPLLLAVPAKAQMYGGMSFNSDGVNSFYLAIGQNYSVPEQQVVVIHELLIPDEELPVIFFIARQAHVTPEEVADLRLAGYSWMDITLYYDLSPSIYYVLLNGDPGPEYGRAYGYWRQPRTRWSHIRFDDDDIVKMVNLQFVSTHYGVRPDEVVRLRGEQSNFVRVTQVISSPEYRSSSATGWHQPNATARQLPRATVRQQPNVTVRPQPNATVRPQPNVTVRPQPNVTVRPQPNATVRPQPNATVRPQPNATVKKQPRATAKEKLSAPAKKQQDGPGQDKERGNGNGDGKDQNDNNH